MLTNTLLPFVTLCLLPTGYAQVLYQSLSDGTVNLFARSSWASNNAADSATLTRGSITTTTDDLSRGVITTITTTDISRGVITTITTSLSASGSSLPSSTSATSTESLPATTTLPWDIVQATASSTDYDVGDFIFPVSPSGAARLQPIFDSVAAACGSFPATRRRDVLVDTVRKRQSDDYYQCAINEISGSEVGAYDVGMSLSIGTITAGSVQVSVANLAAGVVIGLLTLIVGSGSVSTTESAKLPKVDVVYVNPGQISNGGNGTSSSGDDDNKNVDVLDPLLNSLENFSDEEMAALAASLDVYNAQMPFSIRQLVRNWPKPDPNCTTSVSSAISWENPSFNLKDWCTNGENAAINASVGFTSQYSLGDGSQTTYSLQAKIRTDNVDPDLAFFCGTTAYVDTDECNDVLTNGHNTCDSGDLTLTKGFTASGDCIDYTLSIVEPQEAAPSSTTSAPSSNPTADAAVIGSPTCFAVDGSKNTRRVISTDTPNNYQLNCADNQANSSRHTVLYDNPVFLQYFYIPADNRPDECNQLYPSTTGTWPSDIENLCMTPMSAIWDQCPDNGGSASNACGEWYLQTCPDGVGGQTDGSCDPGNTSDPH